MTKATGLALKELLELIESELIRADIDDELHFEQSRAAAAAVCATASGNAVKDS